VTAARLAGCGHSGQSRRQFRNFAGVEHRLEFVGGNRRRALLQRPRKPPTWTPTLKALDAFSRAHPDYSRREGQGQRPTPSCKSRSEKSHSLRWLIGAGPRTKLKSRSPAAWAIERARHHGIGAVEIAAQCRGPRNIVVLAPACGSFDQFQNYEHRGTGLQRSWFNSWTATSTQHSSDKGQMTWRDVRIPDRWLFGVTLVLCPAGRGD